MTHLKVGDIAPEFSASNHEDNTISLSALKGQRIILYFYPKDNTSGCTNQACDLRDSYEELLGFGLQVIGVSPDGVKSHASFRAKHNLPFELIADTNREVARAYGVYGEKKMYGKTSMGIHRTTFIIGVDGRIEAIIPKVNTKEHAAQIKEVI